jgi:hypothetical protein
MQVSQDLELISPRPGAGWKRLNRFLIVMALLHVTAPLRSAAEAAIESAVLDGMKETLVSRWDFQKRIPLAAHAFTHRLSESEAQSLTAQLRAGDAGEAPALAGGADAAVWRAFALGLAADRLRAESGDSDLQIAAAQAHDNIPLNFEMARILREGGMYQRARLFEKETERALLAQGYLRCPELAKLELWRARGELAQGNPVAARQSLEFAGNLDPFTPWVPWLRLEAILRQTPPWRWDLGSAWDATLALARQLRYYDTQGLFLLNVSRALRWGFGIFGMACLAALCARYFPRLAHPLAERLPQAVELRVRLLAVGLIPLSLWVGGGGFIALGLLGVTMAWKHANRAERSLLKASLTGLAVLPLLLLWEHAMCRHLNAALGVSLYHKAYARGYEKTMLQKAEAFPAAGREDSLYRDLAAGLQYKKQGNLIKAAERSALALAEAGNDPLAAAAAGNLALLNFDFAGALKDYQQASATAPGMTEAWFNASQAALYANKSDQHKRYLDRAAELDPEWVTGFLKTNDEHFDVIPPNRKAMDPMLRPGSGWAAALKSYVNLDFAAIPIRTGLMEVPSSWLIGAVLLTAFGLYFRFRRYSQNIQGRDLFECKICGRIMCRTCRKGVHCQNCFKTVSGVHENRVRAELIQKLKIKAAAGPLRVAMIMNLVFPGLGGLYLGATRLTPPLLVSLAFGAGLVMNGTLMEYPAFVLGPLAWAAWIPLACLYLFFTARFAITARRGAVAVAVPASARERTAA